MYNTFEPGRPGGRPNSVDTDAFWMPYTANRQFKAAPRMLVEAQGMHYRADDGRAVLDGVAGLWCVNAGHGRRRIADAADRGAGCNANEAVIV